MFNLPFNLFDDDITKIDIIYTKYESIFNDFINYFHNQWVHHFTSGFLNFKFLKKNERPNSYIENYNRRVKIKLSKYLFGRSKIK